jgi:hypothetical protein
MNDDDWTEEKVERVLLELIQQGLVEVVHIDGDPFPRHRITPAGTAHIEEFLFGKK